MDKLKKIKYPVEYNRIKYFSAKIASIKPLSQNIYLIDAIIKNTILQSKPPQFTLTWIPGYEAIPLSIAWNLEDKIRFIVKTVGKTTKKLVNMKPGEYIGVYGPLGKPLIPYNGDKYLLIAGGSGIAVISHYIQKLCSNNKKYCETIYGAWSFNEIGNIPIYLEKLGSKTLTTCLDKECDIYGVITNAIEYVDIEEYDYIITCGPLKMLQNLIHKINTKYYSKTIFILESMVKCGIGLCGSCRVFHGKNIFLCIDGPGFYLKNIYMYLWENKYD